MQEYIRCIYKLMFDVLRLESVNPFRKKGRLSIIGVENVKEKYISVHKNRTYIEIRQQKWEKTGFNI